MGWIDSLKQAFGGRSTREASPPRRAELPPEHVKVATVDDLDALIASTSFDSAADFIRAHARKSICVFPAGGADDAPGASRLGGVPDVAAGTVWPRIAGEPALFFGQFDLAQLRHEIGPTALPPEGLLSVFSRRVGDIEFGATAIYTAPGAALERLAAPTGESPNSDFEVYTPVAVSFEASITIPCEDLDFFVAEITRLAPAGDVDALREAFDNPRGAIARLLGHAITSFEDLHSFAALASLGRPSWDASLLQWESWERWTEAKKISSRLKNGSTYVPWSESRDEDVRWLIENRERVRQEIGRWQLLFELQSNREMNFSINDWNGIYLFIRDDALAARDFSRLFVAATQS